MLQRKFLKHNPIKDYLSAISCGILSKEIYVDLDYDEDSKAEVDANFIISRSSGMAEIQISGEGSTFKSEDLHKMIMMSENAAKQIFAIQNKVLS